MTHAPLLEAADLVCGYARGRPVLSGVSLTVQPGQTVALVGPSGGGKTTLLRTALGLIAPLAGHVAVAGRIPPARPPAGTVAYAPQGLGLVRHATVLHNVLAGTLPHTGRLRSLLRAFPADHIRRARDAVDRVGLADHADQRVSQLSGGQRRRVSIARALAGRPALLVADEIVSELDDANAGRVLDAITGRQRATGMGVLMVEHDVDRCCAVADVVCCIAGGMVRASLGPGPRRPDRVREVIAAGADPSAA